MVKKVVEDWDILSKVGLRLIEIYQRSLYYKTMFRDIPSRPSLTLYTAVRTGEPCYSDDSRI